MKILMLTPYLPYPLLSGGQIRTYNLLKNLGKKHDITLFSLIKDDHEKQYIEELKKFCKKIKIFKRTSSPWHPRNIIRAGFSLYPFLVTRNLVDSTKSQVEKELATENYDLIHAETFYMMPNIPKTTIPVILAEQTIEYLGYQSYAHKTENWFIKPFLYLDILKIKYWEKHYWESCSELITMSDDDRQFIKSVSPTVKKIDVVANGVDTRWFNESRKKLPPVPTFLFVGTFKWLPNSEAVEFLVEQVWPIIKSKLPAARLWIVGNAPTNKVYGYEKKDPSIKVTGGIPDIRTAYAGAHVLLAPVFSGKGTRYKLLEAMATGTPSVASSIAVEGLGIVSGHQALIADRPADMAAAAIRLITDSVLQNKLSVSGKKYVSDKFDWTIISGKLESIYENLVHHHS